MKLQLACILFALPACVTATTEVATVDQAIVGGQTAQPSEFPSVVALENAPGQWFCTGTLIDPSWILTAAHCVEGETAANLHIRLDDANVADTSGGKVVNVAEIHSNPAFNQNDWDNDIALLKLATPVTDRTPTKILRTQLPMASSVIDVGYGVSDNNDGGGGILRKVTKTTKSCAGAGDPGVSDANLVCMDASDGKGSCFGDSGGPTFATVNGELVVAGVTSGGTGELCGAGWDLYTSVFAELAYVDMIMGTPGGGGEEEPGEGGNTGTGSGSSTTPDGTGNEEVGTIGGCNAGGSSGAPVALFGVALLVRRRRARK